jgi:hypothetical protein
MVVAKNGSPVGPYAAFQVTPTWVTDTYWTASSSPAVAGTQWIWGSDPIPQSEVDNDTTYTFEKKFTWFGPIASSTMTFGVAADNSYEVFLNGNPVTADANETNFASVDMVTVPAGFFNQGTNTLQFKVKNWQLPGAPTVNNPAGLRYKLTIDGNCGDNYFKNNCSLWDAKNLEQKDVFYNFNDVKPGDQGTDVISLHVTSNDAYACLLTTSATGSLDSLIKGFAWEDTNGDGVYDMSESPLYGPNAPLSLLLASINIPGNSGKNVGVAWCAGNQAVDANHVITCDGSGSNNQYQNASLWLSMTGYAEQVRNNSSFTCTGAAATLRHPPVSAE